MRPLIFAAASFILSMAFQLTMAKYGANIPDGWLLFLWLAPLVPFAWWVWTHDKLITRRQKLTRYFQLHPWKTILSALATITITVSCFGGVGYVGWKILKTNHESAGKIGGPSPAPSETRGSTPAPQEKNDMPKVPPTSKARAAKRLSSYLANQRSQDNGIVTGKDSTVVGQIPPGSRVGDRSTVVGATDSNGNTILNRGGLAIGNGAKADSTSVAIGAHANAGRQPISQDCGGGNCAASIGQQGGITAGQVNLGAQDWESLLDGAKQNALIATLKQTKGKFRLEWLMEDIGGMKMAGFLNYAFLHAQTSNYAGSMCFPDQQHDCLGLYVTVRDRNSEIAKTAITAISAFFPKAHVTESEKEPDDEIYVLIAKASW
jgi:hypothetical protein